MKQQLRLCKNGNTWLFDDAGENIVGEPFVEGTSELITEIQSRVGLSGKTLSGTFSDEPFPGSQQKLHWQGSQREGTWNEYHCKDLHMKKWLCPVFLRYFEYAPKDLYVALG